MTEGKDDTREKARRQKKKKRRKAGSREEPRILQKRQAVSTASFIKPELAERTASMLDH